MNSPLVSAVITTYKRSVEVVNNAIESIIKQTYENIEILLIDDNENDSVESHQLKITINEKYPQVIYVKQNGNRGACAARNLGIKHSKGKYIAFLDDDDEWLPNKIKLQVERFADGPEELVLVYGNGIIRDYRSEPVEQYLYNKSTIYDDLSFNELLIKDRIGSTSMPLIKKDVLLSLGGFAEGLPARQDYEMWLRIAERGYKIAGINKPLFYHNMHSGDQVSKNFKKSYLGYRYVYKEFYKYYLHDLKAHRRIYAYLSYCATEAGVRGAIIIKAKYYIIALCDEIRKKVMKEEQSSSI